jgi:hypothetical protein
MTWRFWSFLLMSFVDFPAQPNALHVVISITSATNSSDPPSTDISDGILLSIFTNFTSQWPLQGAKFWNDFLFFLPRATNFTRGLDRRRRLYSSCLLFLFIRASALTSRLLGRGNAVLAVDNAGSTLGPRWSVTEMGMKRHLSPRASGHGHTLFLRLDLDWPAHYRHSEHLMANWHEVK